MRTVGAIAFRGQFQACDNGAFEINPRFKRGRALSLSSSNVWLCYVVVQGTAAKLSLNMLWMSLDVLTAEALTLG